MSAESLMAEAMEMASYHEFGCNADFPKRWCGECDRCVLAKRIVQLVGKHTPTPAREGS